VSAWGSPDGSQLRKRDIAQAMAASSEEEGEEGGGNRGGAEARGRRESGRGGGRGRRDSALGDGEIPDLQLENSSEDVATFAVHPLANFIAVGLLDGQVVFFDIYFCFFSAHFLCLFHRCSIVVVWLLYRCFLLLKRARGHCDNTPPLDVALSTATPYNPFHHNTLMWPLEPPHPSTPFNHNTRAPSMCWYIVERNALRCTAMQKAPPLTLLRRPQSTSLPDAGLQHTALAPRPVSPHFP